MRKPLFALLLALALLATACSSKTGEAPTTLPESTETAETSPESAEDGLGAAEGSLPSLGDTPANGESSQSGPAGDTGGSGIASVQNDPSGLEEIKPDSSYSNRFTSEPTQNGDPNLEESELVYTDENGNETVLVEGLSGSGAVYSGPNSQLFYNDKNGIQKLNAQTGELTPFVGGTGQVFGYYWFDDGTYLYTVAGPADAGPKDKDFTLVKISWADGSVEEIPGVEGIEFFDAFGTTLLYSEWDYNNSSIIYHAYDLATGKTTTLPAFENTSAVGQFRGVVYCFGGEEGVEKSNLLLAHNLVTGEEATAVLDIEAEIWVPEALRDRVLTLWGYNGGEELRRYLNLETGEIYA